MKRRARNPPSSMKKWLKNSTATKLVPIAEQGTAEPGTASEQSGEEDKKPYRCIRPVVVRKGEATARAYMRAKKERGNLRNLCSTDEAPAEGFEDKTFEIQDDCKRNCYVQEKQDTLPVPSAPPRPSESTAPEPEPRQDTEPEVSNPESALVIKKDPPEPEPEPKPKPEPESKMKKRTKAPKAPQNRMEKLQKRVEDNRRAARGLIHRTRQEIKELQPDPFKVGPVTIPASVVGFLEKNAKRFELIAYGLWDFPFELAFHFFKEIGHIIHILAIGFLWIAVWMAVEALAIYGSQGVLKTIFTIVNSIITVVDLMLDAMMTFLFGVVVEVLQVALCKFAPLKAMLSSKLEKIICDDVPGFGNPFPIPRFDLNKFVPETWDELSRMRTTCAEFSSGPEVLEGLIKLIFSPSLCPVVKHVRPVAWLHDLFYYTVGTLTWAQGTTPTYTDPLASLVTKQAKNAGVRGSPSCEPPPDALYCIMFGLGFLIVEILVPLIVVFMVLTPLKTIIKNAIGIAFSFLAAAMTGLVDLCEKLVSTAQWAGAEGAWIAIMVLPLVICAPVGFSLFGTFGLALGAGVGAAVGGFVAFTRGGEFYEGPGPKRIFTLWTASTAIFVLLALAIRYGSDAQNKL